MRRARTLRPRSGEVWRPCSTIANGKSSSAPGARVRRALATPSLVASVAVLVVAVAGLLVLGLPVHALVVALIAWWPWSVLRRRTRRRGPLTS